MSPLTKCDTIAPNLEINQIRFRHIDPDVHADIWYLEINQIRFRHIDPDVHADIWY